MKTGGLTDTGSLNIAETSIVIDINKRVYSKWRLLENI